MTENKKTFIKDDLLNAFSEGVQIGADHGEDGEKSVYTDFNKWFNDYDTILKCNHIRYSLKSAGCSDPEKLDIAVKEILQLFNIIPDKKYSVCLLLWPNADYVSRYDTDDFDEAVEKMNYLKQIHLSQSDTFFHIIVNENGRIFSNDRWYI